MKLQVFSILAMITLLISSCEDDSPKITHRTAQVDIVANEHYRYDTKNSGDEEGASISKQAGHYEISKIIRDESTGFSAIYEYKPKLDYTGTDEVELKLSTGSDGSGSSSHFEYLKITFNISK